MASDVLNQTKAEVRSVLMANSYGVPANMFLKEYEELTGYPFPLKALGITSAHDIPRRMPDVARCERNAQV